MMPDERAIRFAQCSLHPALQAHHLPNVVGARRRGRIRPIWIVALQDLRAVVVMGDAQ